MTKFLLKYWSHSAALILLLIVIATAVVPGSYKSGEYDYDSEEFMMGSDMPMPTFMMSSDAGYAMNESISNSRMVAADDAAAPLSTEQKVIKNGSLDLHVEDVRQSRDEVETLVEGLGGSVLNSNLSRGEGAYSAWMSIRIPSDRFEETLDQLKGLALYVNNQSSNASDVTEEYMDLEARLQNYQAEEEQYLSILDRAETVTEVLEVTSALSNVRYQIESIESRLQYYDTRVDFSTISLYLSEDETIATVNESWRPLNTIKEAFRSWIVFLQDVVDGVVYGLIYLWPLVLVGLVVWLLWRRRR